MKYVVVIGDGMADRPIKDLGYKTPLEAAAKPNMDRIAREGRCGLLKTLSGDMPLGSDVANLSVLGYDPKKYHYGGRGPLEAAAMGIALKEGDIAYRCNLVTEEGGILRDYSGGHISSGEAGILMEHVNEKLGTGNMEFRPGVGYRNLMVLRDSSVDWSDIVETAPHDIVGRSVKGNLLKAGNKEAEPVAEMLNRIMLDSIKMLGEHPINRMRVAEGKLPANMLWFWGGGGKPSMPSFREKYGLKGCMISAVDLLKGIAVYAGLEVINVPGATGYLDTDYAGKAACALSALERCDLAYLHVEAPDEAGHEGNYREKIKAIEAIDEKILGRISRELEGSEHAIALLPDHATPVEARTHTPEPVPFAIYKSSSEGDAVGTYTEKAAKEGSYGLRQGIEFMDLLIKKE
ncbi:MAG: cofactor-independent phosphoglycerate mutase [Candidatus Altiarchaeota archaeon]|nr:cofactor-independent phosphoglycerate mutase [Candidatus Altiarchaeota archaeon]